MYLMKSKIEDGLTPPDKKKLALLTLKKYAIITLGCIFYSIGISLFIEQSTLTAGGMTGVALIIHYLTGFNEGYLLIILNIPMLILGLVFFGWRFLVSTGYATLVSGLLMRLLKFLFGEHVLNLLPFTQTVLVNSVIGAALFGIGMGIIFRMGASTAGTDVIVKILRRKFRHIKTGAISMMTDLIVVGASFFTTGYDWDLLFYSILVVIVFTVIFNRILYGGDSAQLVFVITNKDNEEQIRKKILSEVDSGATIIDGEGGYTGDEKKILFCVVKPWLYPHLRDVIRKVDKHAFMVVTSASEIYGENYKNQDDEEL